MARDEQTDAEFREHLERPTYQNRLRLIGRRLDRWGLRAVNLTEVRGGFVVGAMRPTQRDRDILEFANPEFATLIRDAIAARGDGDHSRPRGPLFPTGYEDFLRALGWRLDQQEALAITVTELLNLVVVTGFVEPPPAAPADPTSPSYGATRSGGAAGEPPVVVGPDGLLPFEALFSPEDIVALTDEAFHRRKAPKLKQGTAFVIERLFGKRQTID